MKKTALITLFILVAVLPAVDAEDYILTINGTTQEIGLDKATDLTLKDGTSLNITLKQKEFLRFTGDLFSFEHKNEFKPNRNDLGDGIFQTMIITPIGTGIIIQEYLNLDPSSLVDMMLKELTKEEIKYGYEYSEKAVEQKVGDITFTGKQAITKYRDDEWTRSVLTHNGKDKGVLIVTFIEKENYTTENNLIDHLWKSIVVKMK